MDIALPRGPTNMIDCVNFSHGRNQSQGFRMVANTSNCDNYLDDEEFHELAEQLLLAVRGGQYPSFEFVRRAADLAESMSRSVGAARLDDTT